jgi:hypothetical protein
MQNVILQSELATVGQPKVIRYRTRTYTCSPEGSCGTHEAKRQDLHRKLGILQ